MEAKRKRVQTCVKVTLIKPETNWPNREQARRAEPVYVAKCWEDLRFVEKDKTELEIAGFLRNIFKYSAVGNLHGYG